MVTFIPPFMGQEIKSAAERHMFDVLQRLDIKNAFVLHSLGLPRHQSKIYGEIDFVIVCDRGVACLEIKGGRVECHNGQWIFLDRYGNEHTRPEGPFAQVIGNMFSLRDELKRSFFNNPNTGYILMAAGVVFPDIEFRSSSEEIIHEMIYDKSTDDITTYVNGIFDYWESRANRKPSKLSAATIKEIVKSLRGDFCFIPTLSDRLDQVEHRLAHLTNEQARVMDALSCNTHLLIEGNAGTGKTLLAFDFAKKSAEKGKRVLFLTYNKNLSKHILNVMEDDIAGFLKVINIHAFFGEYVEVDSMEVDENPGVFFGSILPERFCEYIGLMSDDERKQIGYDVLVMDEGQDIIKPEYLYALDMVLNGGLEHGEWAAFYDGKQNIYNPDYQDGMEILDSYDSTHFALFINCRNTAQISRYGADVSGVSIPDVLTENGEDVQQVTFSNPDDLGVKVKAILKELKKGKVDPRDVVFLGPKRYNGSSLKMAGIPVHEIEFDDEDDLPRYATIQGFKGLDAKVVILTDVEYILPENHMSFMYIAVTRARAMLYVLRKG